MNKKEKEKKEKGKGKKEKGKGEKGKGKRVINLLLFVRSIFVKHIDFFLL